jgi:hypothetical protein
MKAGVGKALSPSSRSSVRRRPEFEAGESEALQIVRGKARLSGRGSLMLDFGSWPPDTERIGCEVKQTGQSA